MGKQIVAVRRMILTAGKATVAYPVGPVLGVYGINLMMFVKDYNARTAEWAGLEVPADITIFADRSFTFQVTQPTASSLLRQAAGIEKGSGEANRNKVGKITTAQLRDIAQRKMPDLNADTVEAAEKIVAGTARNMGIEVVS